MTDRQDIEALQRWLGDIPDPKPSAACVRRVKQGVARAVSQSAVEPLQATPQCKRRLKSAIREELQRDAALDHKHASPAALVVWAGAALSAAAALILMWTAPQLDQDFGTAIVATPGGAPDAATTPRGSADADGLADDSITIASIYDDPETSGLASKLAELELRSAALDYYRHDGADGDWETFQVIEELMRPGYLLDSDETESGV